MSKWLHTGVLKRVETTAGIHDLTSKEKGVEGMCVLYKTKKQAIADGCKPEYLLPRKGLINEMYKL